MKVTPQRAIRSSRIQSPDLDVVCFGFRKWKARSEQALEPYPGALFMRPRETRYRDRQDGVE